MKLRELKQALAAAIASATAISSAVPDGDLMTAEQRTSFDAYMATAETLKGDIARAEQLADATRNAPSIEVGVNHATEKPWASFAEQLQAVRKHATTRGTSSDPRLFAALGGNESVDAEGGFLIAPEFAPGVWQRTYDASELAKRCFEQPISSNRLVINAVDEDSRVDGSRFGGVQSYWLAEAGTFTVSQSKFRQMQLTLHKLIALTYATQEQLDDSVAFSSYIDKVMPMELAFRIDDAVYNGTGAGQPLGFMNSGAMLEISKDSTDTSGTTFVTKDVLAMYQRLWAPSRRNAAWFINQDTEAVLYNLVRGSGVAVEFLYTPPGERGNNSPYGVMLGLPVIPVEFAATQGTPGDIVLADCQQYCLANKGDVVSDSSIHVQYLTDQQAFRWKMRLDGQPFWKKPLTPKNGSNTLSPFIRLAVRS